jgi:hypothetical protein
LSVIRDSAQAVIAEGVDRVKQKLHPHNTENDGSA